MDNRFSGQKVVPNLYLPCTHEIIRKKHYEPMARPITKRLIGLKNIKADCLILSYNNPSRLCYIIESLEKYCSGIDTLYVLYESDRDNKKSYQLAKDTADSVIFLDFSVDTDQEYKNNLAHFLKEYLAKYVLVADDSFIVNDWIDIGQCIHLLEKTYAYGFYFGLSPDNEIFHSDGIMHQIIEDNVNALKLNSIYKHWDKFNTASGTLYRKNDLLILINSIESGPRKSLAKWKQSYVDPNNVGLSFNKSVV